MSGPVLRVAWYRFRVTLRQRWTGYLALVLLIGLVGGLAMGAVAGARRTQSSFPRFLRSTNPSDVIALTGTGGPDGYDPALLRKIGRLPQVKRVAHAAGFVAGTLDKNSPGNVDVDTVGSVDGLLFTQDRVTVTQGRMANPKRADEILMTADAARSLRLQVGDVRHFGVFSIAQFTQNAFGPNVKPYRRFTGKLVGIVVYNDAVVQDDADRSPAHILFTPALARPLTQCCAFGAVSGLQLQRGSRDVAAVETEIQRLLPPGVFDQFHATSIIDAQAERAIKPEAIALGVFGAIAALAAVLIALQVIGRQLRLGNDELDVLRALGASPAVTASDGLIGIVGSVVVGSLLAVGVAVALSPLARLGPVRKVDPSPGIAFDWTVLGVGVLVVLVALSAGAVALAYRGAPHLVARRRPRRDRGSSAARAAASSGLPVETVTGIRFALESGRGRNTAPVRSAILGAALAMIVVIGTVTFGASLHTLVSHPQLYGWNWDYELLASNGGGSSIPDPPATKLLRGDPDVAASAGVYFATLRIDNETVPVLAGSSRAPVGPRLLTGHGVEDSKQVVLGATTLAQLHKHVGDTVAVRFGARAPTRVRIVGTATMPTIGPSGSLHLSIGTGALLSSKLLPATALTEPGLLPGPSAIFVSLRPGVDPVAARHRLQRLAGKSTFDTNGAVSVVSVQRPAEIVNYRTMGSTPALLGAALAAGAVVALGLTLITSVRRRRRDLAILKTLGFTRRQLGAVVAWQSSVAVGIGTVVGVPLGIVVGRALWNVFARELHVVPQPTVPTSSVALIAVCALVLGNIVAAIPGRQAARTPTAPLLRAE